MTERQWIGLILAGCALGLVIVGVLSGRAEAKIYHWENSDGVLCWTDDMGQVPTAYRDKAIVMDHLPPLASYERYTEAPQDRAQGPDLLEAGPAEGPPDPIAGATP